MQLTKLVFKCYAKFPIRITFEKTGKPFFSLRGRQKVSFSIPTVFIGEKWDKNS